MLQQKINSWKSNLIDLSKRNRLLNFKSNAKAVIRLGASQPNELYQSLTKGQSLLVRDLVDVESKIKKQTSEEETSSRLLELYIDLEKRLNNVRLKGKSSLDEKGVHTLYVVISLLKWQEADFSKEDIYSPLILLPVNLNRTNSFEPYYLSLAQEEIVFNPVLAEKLKNDFGMTVQIPFDDLAEQLLEDILACLSDQLTQTGFTIENDVFLANLSFNKLVMYKDLEKYSEKIESNTFLQRMVGIDAQDETFDLFKDVPIREFDRKAKSKDFYQIVDADSSQLEAILAAKNGLSFVMQGPPGTGKSQTITNIISETLSQGKRVLFVSDKIAALSVVKSRLDAHGLGVFCLELHSHNTNKKAVLQSLQEAMDFKSKNPKLIDFNRLDDMKNRINSYVDSLHVVIEPLMLTPFLVHGELSKLTETSDLTFEIEGANLYTREMLDSVLQLLDEIEKLKEYIVSYNSHLWKDASVQSFTHQLQSDIAARFQRLRDELKELSIVQTELKVRFGVVVPPSIGSARRILDLEEHRKTRPPFPSDWLIEPMLFDLASPHAEIDKKRMETFLRKESELLVAYERSAFELPVFDILKVISIDGPEKVERFLSYNDFFDQVENIYSLANGAHEDAKTYKSLQQQVTDLLGYEHGADEKFFEFVTGIQGIGPVPESFFEEHLREEIQNALSEAKGKVKDYLELQENLFHRYDEDVLSEPIHELVSRFADEHASGWNRFFKSGFRKDRKRLLFHQKTRNTKDYASLLQDLKIASKILSVKSWLSEEKERLEKLLGATYKGKMTDFEKLEADILTIQKMIDRGVLTDKAKQYVLQFAKGDDEKALALANSYNTAREKAFASLLNLRKVVESIQDHPLDAQESLQNLVPAADLIQSAKRQLLSARRTNTGVCYEKLYQECSLLCEVVKERKALDEDLPNLEKRYPGLYKDKDTSWTLVLDTMRWFKDLYELYPFPHSAAFMKRWAESPEEWLTVASHLSGLNEKIEKEMHFFFSVFNRSIEENIRFAELEELQHKLLEWIENSYKLEDWLRFKQLFRTGDELKVKDFLLFLLENKETKDRYRDLFLKRFYKLWLDSAERNLPNLSGFQKERHEDMIRIFQDLDKSQFDANSHRLVHQLTDRKNMVVEARNNFAESTFLRKEIGKKTHHKAIRQLFQAIPNLLFALKPCMMMSPMSVSQFLDPDHIEFDIVIFDEASQLGSEDAVGAIFRGKQVIVAGDSKQLPPTRFFSSQNEVDEEEAEDLGVYESVLDECSIFLPQKPLRWHYRSKHESLISFSNKYIYKNSLYTFPSASNTKSDGVSFVYVENGVYDSGGSRQNRVEAKRVAELCIEHFQEHPDRSLGVIAFSEAQQEAIREELEVLRRKWSRMERHFQEDQADAFFIKNLENVQGDERDTIILSVGYGKNLDGKMLYNFGPLSKSGGERRLNVAVTRAKHQIVLVASIRSDDIDVTNLKNEGPRLLKKYLYFCDTKGTFDSEDTYEWNGEYDSPLEEEVHNQLKAAGLLVRPQVGVSNYRIDFGIVDPDQPGRYLLGVEFDGAAYHSSKTARDRDRLRQEILENRGWKIYRIWSQDWFKRKKEIVEEIVALCKELQDITH